MNQKMSKGVKVIIEVEKEKLLIDVDGFELDVYDDLSKEIVPDADKKFAWLSAIGYEIERRCYRISEIEKRQYMTHWRLWAGKWLASRGLRDTLEALDDAIAYLFSESSIIDKIKRCFEVSLVNFNGKEYSSWREFFNDESVPQIVKENAENMYRLDICEGITYDRIMETIGRMVSMTKTLKAISEAYKQRAYFENKLRFYQDKMKIDF